jgi:hypothetical protein
MSWRGKGVNGVSWVSDPIVVATGRSCRSPRCRPAKSPSSPPRWEPSCRPASFWPLGGQKVIWRNILGPGKYRINPYGYRIELVDAISIPIGYVGVVSGLSGEQAPPGEFAEPGQKGARRVRVGARGGKSEGNGEKPSAVAGRCRLSEQAGNT